MSSVETYCTRWGCETAGEAKTTLQGSVVVPVRCKGADAILKILGPGTDEQHAAKVLAYWDGRGAVKLLRHDEGALLMEKAEDDNALERMALGGKDDEATLIIVEVLAQLHSRRAPLPKGLTPLRERFRSLFAKARDIAAPEIYRQAASVAEGLLAESHEEIVLHGDIHLGNVLSSPRGWLAIDPKGVMGERIYDVANILCNPYHPLSQLERGPERMERQASIFCERLAIDRHRLLSFVFVHACLSACWAQEDKEDFASRVECGETARKLLHL
jgi:streptomycin 6-kinase